MFSLTNKQLKIIIAQFDQAIENHNQWYKNLQRVLISHVPAHESDLLPDAHMHCNFGKWYMRPQEAFLLENPTFISLGHTHQKVHHGAKKLIHKTQEGNIIPVEEWDSFVDDLDQMRQEILSLRHDFTETLQNRDPLTEARNRACMFQELQEQLALIQRGKQHCALVMLDIDYFKQINDQYGHSAGDSVLYSTVRCIKSHLRQYDRVYRYGGEEFILCMPFTTIEQASEVVDRIRLTISKRILNLVI